MFSNAPMARAARFAATVVLLVAGCDDKPKDGDQSPPPTDAMRNASAATEANAHEGQPKVKKAR